MDVDIHLRLTTPADLDFVITLERDPETAPFIGQWSRDEHCATLDRRDREHWMIVSAAGERLGYMILYDLREAGHGVYLKRIAVSQKSTGVGRRALAGLLRHAFDDLEAAFMTLAVFPGNPRAQRAYRSVGFTVAELSDEELRVIRAEVDPFPEPCLVMIARP